MIQLTNTSNMTGVVIASDGEDLEALYDELYVIIEGEEPVYRLIWARMQVL